MSPPRPWSETVSPTQTPARVSRTSQSYTNKVTSGSTAPLSIANPNFESHSSLASNEQLADGAQPQTSLPIAHHETGEHLPSEVQLPNADMPNDESSPQSNDQPAPTTITTTNTKTTYPNLNTLAPVEYVESVRRQSQTGVVETSTEVPQRKTTRRARAKPPKKKRFIVRGIVGLVLGTIFFLAIDIATAELKEGSFLTQNWADIPIPINLCFYLFGMKNAPEFLLGAKPRLEEIGPFCYFVYRKRRILEWKNSSLTYMERILFEFNADASKSLDTRFETINLPIFVSVLVAKGILEKFYVGFMGSFVYNSIAMTLRWSGEQWIEEISARQLLEARKVPILEFLHKLLLPLRAVGIPVPDHFGADGFTLANHSFGLTTTISSGELGPFEVYSRTEDGHLLGDIISFKESNAFPGLDEPCNIMTGGDGMFWKRPVVQNKLTIFLQPTCGLIPFVKQYDHFLYGAQVGRYKFDDQWFNMSVNEYRCFCKRDSTDACLGYHSISPCTGGVAPMGFSLPHFHLSPNLLAQVDGLNPDPKLHASFVDMEPNLGAPVNARINIQGVVDMGAVDQVPFMAKLPKVVLPILWMNVYAGADGALGYVLFVGSNFVRYGSFIWLLLGLSYAALSFYRAHNQRKVQAQRFENPESIG